jgi:hypothetical protein
VSVFAQTLEVLHPSAASLMATKDTLGALTLEQNQMGKGAEVAVPEHHLARAQVSAQVLEKTLFMLMQSADTLAAHRTGGQRHEGHQAQYGKAAAGFLPCGLGIGVLMGLGIGQSNASAIDDLDCSTQPEVCI